MTSDKPDHEKRAVSIELEAGAPMADYQAYIHELEAMHGWLSVDLVHNCFLMGEEVGELFKAVRKYLRYYEQAQPESAQAESAQAAPAQAESAQAESAQAAPAEVANRRAEVAEELVDVFNYLCAVANRLDIDMEAAFREKNARNQRRRWE